MAENPPIASTSALDALSTTEKVLLAQACCQLGTQDWTKVAQAITTGNTVFAVPPTKFTPQFCEIAFSALLEGEGYESSNPLAPQARPSRQIAHKYYQARLEELVKKVGASFEEEEKLAREITEIESGAWDARLMTLATAEGQEQLVPVVSAPAPAPAPFPTPRVPMPFPVPAPARESRARVGKDGKNGHSEIEADGQGEEDVEMMDVTIPDSEPGASGSSTIPAASQVEEKRVSTRGGGKLDQQKEKETTAEEEVESDGEAEVVVVKERKGKGKGGRASTVALVERKSTRGKPHLEEDEVDSSPALEDEGDTPAAETEIGEGEEEETKVGLEEEEMDEGNLISKDKKGRRKPPVKGRRSKRKTSEPAELSPAPTDKSKKRFKADLTSEDSSAQDKESKAAIGRFRKTILLLLDQLSNEPNAHFFKTKVLRNQASNYEDAVKRPMNITEVARRVRSGVITDSKEVMRDVALIFANAVQYNGVKTEIGQQAQALWLRFEEMMELHLTLENANRDE